MKLKKIKLYNYRCFGPNEQVIDVDDMTTFIGNNCTGKTAALSALNYLFSENSSDRILQRSDFYLPKDKSPDQMTKQNLYIEVVFKFDELENNDAIAKETVPPFFERFVAEEPGGSPYLRIRMEATWVQNATVEGSIESQVQYITCPEGAEITDENRITAHRRDLDKICVIYVPAVRDPSRQLKNTSGTMMYRIMRNINWSDETRTNIKKKIEELNTQFQEETGVSMFGSSISGQWKQYDSDARYTSASLRFNSTDIETAIRNTEVVFQPTVTGKEYNIDQMSDGLRSLFYLSLVDSILDVEQKIQEDFDKNPAHPSFNEKPPLLTIVALEEPENHIAPHLLGKLVKNLDSIAKKKNAQVILASHSPVIIKRIDPENLRYFRLEPSDWSARVKRISLPDKKIEERYKYVKEAVKAYPELYFAKLVILGEGDSEEIIIPRFLEAMNIGIDASGISIVPLGGRHVNHFWRLLSDLHIPFITLLDLDRERDGGGWGRIHYAITQLKQINRLKEPLTLITDEEFEEMPKLDVTETECMQICINELEHHDVYYSAPLDIDFLMLEHFESFYKGILSKREGPRVALDTEEKSIKHTLKERGGDGSTYTKAQKKLMVWYNYFFLNRGKPSTHIAALLNVKDEDLVKSIPPVLGRLLDKVKQMIEEGSV